MPDAKQLIRYCLTLSNVYEDYPFGEGWAVLRHRKNKKSFALIYMLKGQLCINLKCEPMRADFLRQALDAVIPAYHMNKTHWNTVKIDGTLENEQIYEMILHSYSLTRPKQRRNP